MKEFHSESFYGRELHLLRKQSLRRLTARIVKFVWVGIVVAVAQNFYFCEIVLWKGNVGVFLCVLIYH